MYVFTFKVETSLFRIFRLNHRNNVNSDYRHKLLISSSVSKTEKKNDFGGNYENMLR